MKHTNIWIFTAILIICNIIAVQAETLRGTVKDAITGEPLIGATVRISELENVAAVSDIDGNYIINIKQGLRYTPIDVEQMRANVAAGIIDDNPIYKDNEAFSKNFDPTSIIDLTVSYKINKRKVSHTIAFEGLNVLGTKTPMFQRFDLGTLDVRTDKGGISLPNLFYRLDF